MGRYIYEGHMGSLYCSDEKLDYDYLYCDECGDSDSLVGYAETLEDAWKLLKPMTSTFDDSICENCPHNEDYDYCDEKCEAFEHSGGYDLNYVMDFLVHNFPCDVLYYGYLISRHIEDKDWIFVDVDPLNFKFGERHRIVNVISPFEEFIPQMVRGLQGYLDGYGTELKEIAVETRKGKIIYIYECIEVKSEEFPNNEWKDRASYKGDSWYGYMPKDKIELIDEQRFLEKYFKE